MSRPESLFCWPPPTLVREDWAVCFGVCEATWCGAPGDVPAGEMRGKPVLAFLPCCQQEEAGNKQLLNRQTIIMSSAEQVAR